MAHFTVNGQAVTVEQNQKLLRYLRDTLHLTSVKDGCSEGACGTCTILVDGRAVRSCILTTKKAAGQPRPASPRRTSWRASPSSRWRD